MHRSLAGCWRFALKLSNMEGVRTSGSLNRCLSLFERGRDAAGQIFWGFPGRVVFAGGRGFGDLAVSNR